MNLSNLFDEHGNFVEADGAIMLTGIDGHDHALLTVRGKDHDLTPQQMRRMASALIRVAQRIEARQARDA